MISHFPSQHQLALEDTLEAATYAVFRDNHVRCFSRQSRTSTLEANTFIVSRWSRTLSLEAITYIVSQGDHVRRRSGRLRTSSLASNSHLKTWLRDAGYMCNVRAQCVVRGFIMAAILPFAFEVGCECFFGQARMHICVHLHTRACKHVHGYRYGCRYVHV